MARLRQLEFNFDPPTLSEMLEAAAQCEGRYFWTMREVARILETSASDVWWLIVHYRLDALLTCGQYRIPWTSIARYQREKRQISAQYHCYKHWMHYRRACRFLELRAGYYVTHLMRRQKIPMEMIRRMPKRELPDPQLWTAWNPDAETEESFEDWYDLPELGLPFELTAEGWASLLRVDRAACLTEAGWFSGDLVDWPTVYDYLVEHEMVNLPAGYRIPDPNERDQNDPVVGNQLELNID